MEIRKTFSLDHDRMYQVLRAEGIPLRRDPKSEISRMGVLPLPPALLAAFPDLRFLPRLKQAEIADRFRSGSSPEELKPDVLRYQKYE